jgi:hypothetical protein
VTITVTGNASGGTGNGTNGWSITSTGPANLMGNATGGNGATSYGISSTSTSTVTVTGNCVGSDTNAGAGCSNTNGTMTVTGNLISGLKGAPTYGAVTYTPAAMNYILFPKNASYVTGMINANSTQMFLSSGASCVAACTGGWH